MLIGHLLLGFGLIWLLGLPDVGLSDSFRDNLLIVGFSMQGIGALILLIGGLMTKRRSAQGRPGPDG